MSWTPPSFVTYIIVSTNIVAYIIIYIIAYINIVACIIIYIIAYTNIVACIIVYIITYTNIVAYIIICIIVCINIVVCIIVYIIINFQLIFSSLLIRNFLEKLSWLMHTWKPLWNFFALGPQWDINRGKISHYLQFVQHQFWVHIPIITFVFIRYQNKIMFESSFSIYHFFVFCFCVPNLVLKLSFHFL